LPTKNGVIDFAIIGKEVSLIELNPYADYEGAGIFNLTIFSFLN